MTDQSWKKASLGLGRAAPWGVAMGLSLVLMGCKNEAVLACHAEMETSQKILLAMDKQDLLAVKGALASIEGALKTCTAAKRRDEVADLEEAERNVKAHVAALEQRQARPEKAPRTPEEIETLKKQGDPKCPKGQAYELKADKALIKCTGPTLLDMNYAQVSEYFVSRGFAVATKDGGQMLRAEYGADLFVYRFGEDKGGSKASCLSTSAIPGAPWQEVAARVSGVQPSQIQAGRPLPTQPSPTPLRLEGEGADKVLHFGACDGVSLSENPHPSAQPAPKKP